MSDSLQKFEIAQAIAKKWFFVKTNLVAGPQDGLAYWRYRILRPLLKALFRLYRVLNSPSPWIAPAATAILRNVLTKDMVGFEYGSGLSTVFLSPRLLHLTSVEHYDPWFQKVTKLLRKRSIPNVTLKLVAPDLIKTLPESPTKSEQQEIIYGNEYYDYSKYVREVKNQQSQSIDFLLVDGRERVKCFFAAFDYVEEGGIIVLDNSERAGYQPIHDAMKAYPKVMTTTGLTDTTIWFKTQTN